LAHLQDSESHSRPGENFSIPAEPGLRPGVRYDTQRTLQKLTTNGLLLKLRVAARIAVATGAIGSVALVLYVGRRNESRLLPSLFALWVLSPFLTAVAADVLSKRWTVLTRAALYGATMVVTLLSLALFGHAAAGPTGIRATRVFVLVPPVSCLLLAAALATAALISRRRSR